MYKDAKKYIGERVPSIEIDDHSSFTRKTSFDVTVDKENTEEGNAVARDIHTSLDSHLRSEFGLESENFKGGETGDSIILGLSNSVYFVTHSPFNNNYDAGSLAMEVVSRENGDMGSHDAVVQACFRHINKDYANKLLAFDGKVISVGASGDGSRWGIDLSGTKLPPKLELPWVAEPKYLKTSN